MLYIFVNFISGICLLIFGISKLSRNLESISNNIVKKMLSIINNEYTAFIVGTFITAFTQSSTAITLITVSLVNARILSLTQAVGIIYGANLGTTITAQLISVNLSDYSLVIFSFGFITAFMSKRRTLKVIGSTFMGLGFMFLGIKTLQASVIYLKGNKLFFEILNICIDNPVLAIIFGAITTMLIQSSSTTVGLTIILFNEDLISLSSAVALTLGDNIGTCMTAQLASLTCSINARRTAWAHTLYNIFGVIMVLFFLEYFKNAVEYITLIIFEQDKTKLIANSHTLFNILSAAVFLPLTKYYVRFIEWMIPESTK